jgi:hypothetical protein
LAILADVQQIIDAFSEKFSQFPRSIGSFFCFIRMRLRFVLKNCIFTSGLISLLRSVLLHSAPFRRVVSANHWLCQLLLQWHSEGRNTMFSSANTVRGLSSRGTHWSLFIYFIL